MSLPLLPMTGVGSNPKPHYVIVENGRLNETSKRAISDYLKFQESVSIDVLVDGEPYVLDMATDFAVALGLPLADWTRSYDNRFWRKGIVDRQLQRAEPIRLKQFEYAQSQTHKPVKAMLTGPTTLSNWNFNNHYKTREELVVAWANVIRQEALALDNTGARYIQIDEPAIGERHWEKELFIEGLRIVTNGLKAYTITHICYGDFPLVFQNLKYLPVSQIDIELSSDLELGLERSDILQMLKEDPLTKYKDVAVGVIDIKANIPVESLDTVVRRIYTALEVLAPNYEALRRIWIDADCGFRATKDSYIAEEKLRVMAKAVKKVRKDLESR